MIPSSFTQYQLLRGEAPDLITMGVQTDPAQLPLWRDTIDLLGDDPYPLYGPEPDAGYDHGQVADWAAAARTAVMGARPFVTVLQFFQSTSNSRWPTAEEMRSHAIRAVVKGAHALFWGSVGSGHGALETVCSNWCSQRVAYMQNSTATVSLMSSVTPALLAPDAPAALASVSNPAIQTLVEQVNGLGYIFAFNNGYGSQTAQFTWSTVPSTVTVAGEQRSLTPSGAGFSDTFGPFEGHVYEVD